LRTYNELNAMLTGRNQQSKKADNNTYCQRRGDDIALMLHSTDVLTYKKNGDIILNSGGWHTPTTKDRMNQGLAGMAVISQDKGIWYLMIRHEYIENGGTYRFNDGMILHRNGKVSGAAKDDTKKDKATKAKIKKFAILCSESLPLDKPSSGDCWYCSMQTDNGESLGDATKDIDHLESHIKEGYIVPSLVYNALKQNKVGDLIIAYAFKDTGVKDYSGHTFELTQDYVKRAVYRYMSKRYGFSVR